MAMRLREGKSTHLHEVHRSRISIPAPLLFSWLIFRVNWIPTFFSLIFTIVQVERVVLYIRRYFAMAAVRRVLMHHLCTSHSLICMHILEVGVCV